MKALDNSSLQPTTTEEEDKHTKTQRHINIIWESTQAAVALSVTGSTLYVAAKLAIITPSQTAAFLLLSNSFFLVVGFYFGRTNHSRPGGVNDVSK